MTAEDDGDHSGPRFEAALARLRQELQGGRYQGADMLPAERELAEALSISRSTLRRVLARLAEEGRLVQRQGIGTFVVRQNASDQPARTARLPDFLWERASLRELGQSFGVPTTTEAFVLGCGTSETVLRRRQLFYLQVGLVAFEESVVTARLLGGRSRVDGPMPIALAETGINLTRILERAAAVILKDAEALMLEAPRGSAGLAVSRAYYSEGSVCCAFSRTIGRADRYELTADHVP